MCFCHWCDDACFLIIIFIPAMLHHSSNMCRLGQTEHVLHYNLLRYHFNFLHRVVLLLELDVMNSAVLRSSAASVVILKPHLSPSSPLGFLKCHTVNSDEEL